jgi:aminomethyltransferase
MGEFEIRGRDALPLLESALTNSAAQLREGQAQYTLACLPSGGVIDDLIVYRLGPEHYLLCVNAGNLDADREWLLELNKGRADFRDVSLETALLAVQGPKAKYVVQSLTSTSLEEMPRFAVLQAEVAGHRAVVARTGYTGEDGFEIFVGSSSAAALFEALISTGEKHGLMPCGLGARDTLRLEAGLALYGHELDRETTALEAGLHRFVKLRRDFVGAEKLRAQHESGLAKRLCGLTTDDGKSIARQGYKLYLNGAEIGQVTSGSFAPHFRYPVAMAYLRTDSSQPNFPAGEKIEVEIRNRRVSATIATLPFYRYGSATVGLK